MYSTVTVYTYYTYDYTVSLKAAKRGDLKSSHKKKIYNMCGNGY